jgi:glyceraldehyde 3-phosphate dehydrogenase
LENNFGIEKAMMTTVHSYTASQRLQDAPAKDLREARNAATNIVPTTTGASIAAAQALPALEGIFGGLSVRVPTPVVSLSDFVVVTKKKITPDEVNEVFKKAAADPYYQGILDITEEELVSSDFIGNSHSAIVDLKLTNVVDGNLLKVVAWYDNEWGYSNRLVELTADVAQLLDKGDKADHEISHGSNEPKPKKTITIESPTLGTDTEFTQSSVEKPQVEDEPLLQAPKEAHEGLLPKPKSLEHDPEAAYIITEKPDLEPPVAPHAGQQPAKSSDETSKSDNIRRF